MVNVPQVLIFVLIVVDANETDATKATDKTIETRLEKNFFLLKNSLIWSQN